MQNNAVNSHILRVAQAIFFQRPCFAAVGRFVNAFYEDAGI